jgi:6-phosphofructokinase
MSKLIGILTAGGDTPGLNAALRGIGKAALESYGMKLIGFYDGFQGLMQNRTLRLDEQSLSGILTLGGTILGTSRDKPHKMPVGGQHLDMTDAMLDTYTTQHLDVLVCIGGGGTQKSALRLMKKGLNIITLPKTIDNDVVKTDVTFGYDTALGVATEAIDRLHSTAHSHHRIVVVETMGHNAGWLGLGAGLAGGADVILIPEIAYDINKVAEAVLQRSRSGKRFSIVAISEGAMSLQEAEERKARHAHKADHKGDDPPDDEDDDGDGPLSETALMQVPSSSMRLAAELEGLTGLESRVTILGYLQRGGTPSAGDRLLATRLGTATARLIKEGVSGVMVAAHGEKAVPVPLDEVAGKRKTVPLDHPWIESARLVGTSLGD